MRPLIEKKKITHLTLGGIHIAFIVSGIVQTILRNEQAGSLSNPSVTKYEQVGNFFVSRRYLKERTFI